MGAKLPKPHLQLVILLAVAIVFGGGGVSAGISNLIVELAAIAVIALNRPAFARFMRATPRPVLALMACTILLPALHLIPLPPAIWMLFPGRDAVAASLTMENMSAAWFPLSLDPNRTAIALAAIITCMPFVVLSADLDDHHADWAFLPIVLLALVSVGIGAIQLANSNRVLMVDPRGVMPHQLYATFANHNASGLFFVIALIAVAGIRSRTLGRWIRTLTGKRADIEREMAFRGVIWLRLGIGAVLALCVVLSQSRSSIALLMITLFWMAWWRRAELPVVFRNSNGRISRYILISAAVVMLVGVTGIVAIGNGKISQSFSRFSDLDDARLMIWEDTTEVVKHYFPVGAGVGSFSEVFQLDESLEFVTAGRAGRAHNDYLEVAVESGVAGLGLVLAWLIWMVRAVWRGANGGDRLGITGSASILACLMLQSFVDYPLRNLALLSIAATMVGVLCRPVKTDGASGRHRAEQL